MNERNGHLPSGWVQTTLGEVGAYHNGRAFKKHEWSETGRPIIRIQNLTDPTKPFNHYEGDGVDPRNEVARGDLLVSWAATLDVFRWSGPDAVLNQHIFKVESYIDPAYHYFVLKAAIDDLYARSHGSGMVHITRDRFDNIPVPLPPLAEQRRIAIELEVQLARVDEGRAAFVRASDRLDGYRAATLRSVLSGDLSTFEPDVARVLREAPRLALRELAPIQYGHTASAQEQPVGPQMLRITDIQDGRVDWAAVPYCEASPEDAAKYRLAAGDIVFARMGFTTGKSYLIRADVPENAVYASYLIRVRPDKRLDPAFLALLFQGAEYWEYVYSQRRGIDRPTLNAKILGNIPVPVPPLEVQRALVTEASRHLVAVENARRSFGSRLEQVEVLDKSLLHAAVSGQLVDQDPSEEPASALLEAIRAAEASRPLRKRTVRS